MRISDFDYDLPNNLIAQHPLDKREDSRMMIIDRARGRIEHSRFKEIAGFMGAEDILVINNTRVIPAKAWGKKDGKEIEFLFIREKEPGAWEVLCRPAKKARPGDRIVFAPGFEARVEEEGAEGLRTLRFGTEDILAGLRRIGFAPLPPYIKRRKDQTDLRTSDLDRYQTVFARNNGAIAAPTAGLHFIPDILEGIRRQGALVREVTLEVGIATFQPVRVDRIEEHRMLEERYEVPPETARDISAARTGGRRVTAVGTTVVRTLESAWSDGVVRPGPGATSLFIHPGFEYRVVDRLLTNFHLPKSTLLMLVSALAGTDLIMEAYREAVRERYRFFSYGDCMLIL
jgi:S-adenosylmethionine:tRNA ribosyltransferase-isomerase